jgi:5-methylcytosine-specific restriction endonuclease McrA
VVGPIKMKRCNNCGQIFPATSQYFHKCKKHKDGFHYYCKHCRSLLRKEYHEQNKEHENHLSRKWKQYNEQQRKTYNKEYRKRNRLKIAVQTSKWKKDNRDRVNESARRRYKNDPIRHVSYVHSYCARKRNAGGQYSKSDILSLLFVQDNKCFYCSTILDKYEIDHFIPLSKGGRNNIDNLVVSCIHCNRSKSGKLPSLWEGWNNKYPPFWSNTCDTDLFTRGNGWGGKTDVNGIESG